MPLDLGLIPHPPDTEPIEWTAKSASNRMTDRGLTHTRRANQQHDGATDIMLENTDRQKLDDSLLHIIKPIMIRIQNFPRLFDIQLVLMVETPGDPRGPGLSSPDNFV